MGCRRRPSPWDCYLIVVSLSNARKYPRFAINSVFIIVIIVIVSLKVKTDEYLWTTAVLNNNNNKRLSLNIP